MQVTSFQIKRLCDFLIASMFFGFAMNEFNLERDFSSQFNSDLWICLFILIILIRVFLFVVEKIKRAI